MSVLEWYTEKVFPWLADYGIRRNAVMNRERAALLKDASGHVLEIGFGTGLNLPFYPPDVRHLIAVDPNPGMHARAKARIRQSSMRVDTIRGSAESMPFDAGTFDTVVSTLTLCSIPDVQRAMAEVYRVLRPGGRFLFLEHGLSPSPSMQKLQRWLTPIQMVLAGGCHLDRDIPAVVRSQPFATLDISSFDALGFKACMFRGRAEPGDR